MNSAPSISSTREICMTNTFYDQSSIFESKRRKKKHLTPDIIFKSNTVRFFSFGSFLALICTVILFTPTRAEEVLHRQETWMKNELIKSIRDELTEAELHSIFGSPDQIKMPNFDIISPQIFHHKAPGKRSTHNSPSSPVPSSSPSPSLSKSREDLISRSDSENDFPDKFVQIDGLGRRFNLTLRPNLKLLDPDFVHLFRHENRSEILPVHHVQNKLHCFYQGTAYSYLAEGNPANHSQTSTNRVSSGRVALSLCEGLQGLIISTDGNSEQEHYVIHPVPERLHANGKLPHKNHHFLWKRDNGHTNVDNHRGSRRRNETHPSSSSDAAENSMDHSSESTCSHNLEKGNRVNKKVDDQLPHYSVNNGMNEAQPKYQNAELKKVIHHHRRRRSRPSTHEFPISPLSIGADLYWLRHRTTVSPTRSAWQYRSTEKASYNQRVEADDEYDVGSSNADYNWQKRVLEYESSSTSSSEVNTGRRKDNFFGENWKSSLDSDLTWSEKKEKRPSSTITIETAVFVDKDLFKHMQSNFPEDTQGEVTRIVLAMINDVQLLYQHPSLGRQVDFVLKRLEVLESDPPGLLRPYDIDRFLTNFCKWQKRQNPVSDADPLHWDHALILTGLDLYVVHQSGTISNQVVGMSPVSGMCARASSCTVSEGRHFGYVYIVAHEIGHNLGMRNDGPQAENSCDPTSHIMSPSLGPGKMTWSECSKTYLEKFMETSQSKCLLDRARSESRLDHEADGRLSGERFDADRQCVLKYGRGSYHATQQPLEDVCRDLHCRREHYTWTSHPALEGTYCGLDMWCRGGKCVNRKSAPIASFEQNSRSETTNYTSPKALDGSWGKWSLFTDCYSACLYSNEGGWPMGSTGIRLAARACDSPRPENGGMQCSGTDRRYKTCSANRICSIGGPRTTIAQYANEVCNRAASVDTELTGRGFMTNSNDPERACAVWCKTADEGGSRNRGWSFPDGTACKLISQSSSASYYCVAGKCQEFSCSSYSYFGLSDEECSFTNANEGTPRSWLIAGSNRNIYRSSKPGWSNWETRSECKSTCLAPAKGLQLVKRNCANRENNCSGLAVSLMLCKPDKATMQMNGCSRLQTPFEYATKICSEYAEKITGLSGIGMQISATKEDPDIPCRVVCQDNTVPYKFYMVNVEEGWFPAGTDCSRGDPKKKAYSLGGKCIDFGDDDTPIYRKNTKVLERLEALFQRTKRQAVYNNMEQLHTKSTLNQNSLKHLVHQFLIKNGI